MLKLKVLKCDYDDLCNIKLSIVVKVQWFGKSRKFCQYNSLFYELGLDNLEPLLSISLMTFKIHQTHFMISGQKSDLTLNFAVCPKAIHSCFYFIFVYRRLYSFPVTIRYEKRSLWQRVLRWRPKCWKTISRRNSSIFFFKFRGILDAGHVIDYKVAIFELRKPLPWCILDYGTFFIYNANISIIFGNSLINRSDWF